LNFLHTNASAVVCRRANFSPLWMYVWLVSAEKVVPFSPVGKNGASGKSSMTVSAWMKQRSAGIAQDGGGEEALGSQPDINVMLDTGTMSNPTASRDIHVNCHYSKWPWPDLPPSLVFFLTCHSWLLPDGKLGKKLVSKRTSSSTLWLAWR
jgi:hypothetical protein